MGELVAVARLWLRETKSGKNAGKKYMSGYLGDANVLIFKNEQKEEGVKGKDHDYTLMIGSRDKDGGHGKQG